MRIWRRIILQNVTEVKCSFISLVLTFCILQEYDLNREFAYPYPDICLTRISIKAVVQF